MRTFHVPAHWRVLVMDDSKERLDWFNDQLPQAKTVMTAAAALELLSAQPFDLVFLDHDLDWTHAAFPQKVQGTGKQVAAHLASVEFPGRVVIHSLSDQAQVMQKLFPWAICARFGEFDINLLPLSSPGAARSPESA